MPRLRMAVIGVGHLGKEHARILSGLPEVELAGVADVNLEQAQLVAQRCSTRGFGDHRPLLSLVDAAVIAVPTVHHHAVAGDFLRRGVPILVEKPFTSTLPQAEDLAALAERRGVLLQVGHIERFNPAFEELAGHPLQPKFVECERLSPFSGRSTDIGVILDMMIHDLDLLLALGRSPVVSVEAVGVTLFGGHEDMANARLTFANGCVANLTASRANASAVRGMRIWAPEGYAGLDFAKRTLTLIQPSKQLRCQGVDRAGWSLHKTEMFGRHFQILQRECPPSDPLTRELEHFIHCVRTGSRPRVNGADGLAAMALASRVLDSLRSHAWEGNPNGPKGPDHLPAPLGPLFDIGEAQAAA